MYEIANYDSLYKPTTTKGHELVHARYVKVPVKPRGKGLRALLKMDRGLEVFGVWTLLLQAATESEKPENRGKLLNHRDEPASELEIAEAISLDSQVSIVSHALSLLTEMGWLYSVQGTDKVRSNYGQGTELVPPNITKDKLSEVEGSEGVFSLQKFIDYGVISGLTEQEAEECHTHYKTQRRADGTWQYGNGLEIPSVADAVTRWRNNRGQFAGKNEPTESAHETIKRLREQGDIQ
jgi:hypothetical protein